MRLRAVLLTVLVILAGCTDDPSSSPDTTVVQVNPGNRVPTKGPVDLGSGADARTRPLDTVTGLLFTAPIYQP